MNWQEALDAEGPDADAALVDLAIHVAMESWISDLMLVEGMTTHQEQRLIERWQAMAAPTEPDDREFIPVEYRPDRPAERLEHISVDPEFPTQTYDAQWGRWCHTAADLYRWLTRPNEEPDRRTMDGVEPTTDAQNRQTGTQASGGAILDQSKLVWFGTGEPEVFIPHADLKPGDVMPGLVECPVPTSDPDVADWVHRFNFEHRHWPPPAKGTHESDLGRHHVCGSLPHGCDEYDAAQVWSRSA